MLNRELQLNMLREAEKAFPNNAGNILKTLDCHDEIGTANIFYLEQHGLIEVNYVAMRGHKIVHGATITAKGLDFLADDGGIGATLAIVTIKIHEESLRQLMIKKVDASPLPEGEKRSLRESINSLPGEGIKHLMTKFVDMGFDNMPKALDLISKAASYIPLQ